MTVEEGGKFRPISASNTPICGEKTSHDSSALNCVENREVYRLGG